MTAETVQHWRAQAARGEALALRYGAPMLYVALAAAVAIELSRIDWRTVIALAPHKLGFWLIFAAFYSAQPVGDWLIYRAIWGMPARGLAQLYRKTVSNDLLVGYSGEAYLYACARRSGRGSGETLAALKDVSILSAAVGNGLTVMVALVAAPFLGRLAIPFPGWWPIAGLAAVLSAPIVALAARGRLLHLPAEQLRTVAALHAGRAIFANLATLMLWHLALPEVPALTWLVLIATKLLVTRLPLVSNKELVFAGIALVLLGPATPLAALMTLLATLVTVSHVAVGLGLVAAPYLNGLWRVVRPGYAIP
jgi:hypothetical protein